MDVTHNALPHFVRLFHIKIGRGHKSCACSIARSVLQLDFACFSTKPVLLDVGKWLLHSPHWAGCVRATLTPLCNLNYTISICGYTNHLDTHSPVIQYHLSIYLDLVDSLMTPAAGLATSNQPAFQNGDYHGFLAQACQVLLWPPSSFVFSGSFSLFWPEWTKISLKKDILLWNSYTTVI